MIEIIQDWLVNQGINNALSVGLVRSVLFILVIVLGFIANGVTKRIILSGLSTIIARTEFKWDDTFLKWNVLNKLSHMAPVIVIYIASPLVLTGYDRLIALITSALFIYMIIIVILVIDSALNAFLDIYKTYEIAREIPIKGLIQVLKIAVYFIGGIFVLSIILNKTPLYLLSGLGALTAVLMLIFKDTILGFVAGIQLTANKMVAYGDWIEMPQYGADGDVLEVALTTVKVQNWDKTITTIPTSALINESFKNWRGMSESGGRRIKRAIYLDISSIRLCTEEMLENFLKIQYISEYIEKQKRAVAEYNVTSGIDDSSLVNGRRLTNIGTFRAYIFAYLKNHPMINQDMTFLIRQLAPTKDGLPIEIYVFCKDKEWINYERIQADIFDHLLAIVPEFGLKVFQNPTGSDFNKFTR